ncbi:MAG: hypothetical protein WD851_12910 [Pirellulales bacterium]
MGPVGEQRANGKRRWPAKSGRGAWMQIIAALAVVMCDIGPAGAQRVQIPQVGPGVYGGPPPTTFSGPSTWPAAPGVAAPVTPPPAFDPYATGAGQFAAPPVAAPYNSVPYNPGAVAPVPITPYPTAPGFGAPPPAGPYPGTTFGGMPYSPQPYSGVPPAPSVYGNSPALEPNPAPGNWPMQAQSGSWGYQQPDGSVVTFQKLIQELSAEFTFVAGSNAPNEFGIDTLELTSTFAVPVFANIDTPLLITPGFAFNWLSGPEGDPEDPESPAMPPRVYDAYLDLAWYPQFSEMFGADVGFRTGVWTDFEHVTDDSMRFLGRGVGRVRLNPQVEVLAGAVYLDRVDVKILPVGGVHWIPNPDWDLYLVFPNPKARRRFTTIGNSQWWWYVSGEYGGDSWTVDRGTVNDRVDYNDIRVIVGLEWETQTLIHGFFEVGYVWDREIVFADSGAPAFKPDDTYMLRTGVDF